MAQRGGAVQSHLRYSDGEIYSDLIPTGRADLVLSVEPLEVLRYWHYLAPDGWVVTSVTPYVNIPDYPETGRAAGRSRQLSNLVMVDSAQLAKAAGNLRAQNMVAVGAASPLLDFTEEQLLKSTSRCCFRRKGEKIVEVNRRAFRSRPRRGLVLPRSGGRRMSAASPPSSSVRSMDPETIEPGHASRAGSGAVGQRLEATLGWRRRAGDQIAAKA